MRRRLGSGGFATVWLAYDEQLDAEVAVKVLADNWAHDDSVRHRFLEEGRFLRRVESEHVVQVHDVGELEDGRPFLVLTYADRGTLADRLKKEPLPLDAAVGVIVQVGRGLQALHRRGLLHRDVKPANVLFRSTDDEGERAVLSDLGLGKSLDEVSRITMPGGTPSYVAPEQAMGERLDQRADQYSLGAVAYAALTGRSPHQVDGLGAAGRVEAPPPPSSLGFAVPERVDDAIVRALDPDREKRWPDVASFTRDLVGALDETTQNFVAPIKKTTGAAAAGGAKTQLATAGAETAIADAEAETATVDPAGEATALSDSNQPTVIKTTPEEALPGPQDAGADEKAAAATAPVALLNAPTGTSTGAPADASTDAPAGASTGAQDGSATIAVPRRRRRGRWVIAAVLALILGGGAGFFAQRYYEPRRIIPVGSGPFTAKLPKELAGFVVEGTWTPPGATAERQSFRVSKDDNWGAQGTSTPGLFIGVMAPAGDPAKLLTSGQRLGCSFDGDKKSTTVNGHEALDMVSTGCPGENVLLQRILTSAEGYSLLIQVMVHGSDSDAATVADTVSYTGGPTT